MKEIKKDYNNLTSIKFEVLMAVTLKIIIFWDMMQCSCAEIYHHFKGT